MDLKQKHVNNLFDKYRWHVGDTIFSNPRKVLKWFLAAWVLFMVTLFALSCDIGDSTGTDEVMVEEVEDFDAKAEYDATIAEFSSITSKGPLDHLWEYNKILKKKGKKVYVFFPAEDDYN